MSEARGYWNPADSGSLRAAARYCEKGREGTGQLETAGAVCKTWSRPPSIPWRLGLFGTVLLYFFS